MADESVNGIAQMLSAFLGGGATSLIAAGIGQLVHHSSEVRSKRRKFVGPELIWAPFVAVFVAMIGEAIGSYFQLSQSVMTGVIAVLGYLGPAAVKAIIDRWLDTTFDDKNKKDKKE